MIWTAESVVAAAGAQVAGNAEAAAVMQSVAPVLARLFNRQISIDDAGALLEAAVPGLQRPAGATTGSQSTGVNLAGSVVLGNLEIDKVAGRDQYNFQITVGGRTFEVGERTLYWATEEELVARLSRIQNQASLVDFAWRDLGLDPTTSDVDVVHVIARELMATTFAKLTAFAKAVAIHDCEVATAIADIAWPFCWVSPEAAAVIPTIPTRPERQRGFGLNSARVETADQYLRRAPMARREYEMVQVSARNVEGIFGELTSAITTALAAKLQCLPELCDAMLRPPPWIPFVILAGDLPDDDLLADLRDRFPTVTFVILAGPLDQAAFANLRLQFADLLVPPIRPGADDEALLELARVRVQTRCIN